MERSTEPRRSCSKTSRPGREAGTTPRTVGASRQGRPALLVVASGHQRQGDVVASIEAARTIAMV